MICSYFSGLLSSYLDKDITLQFITEDIILFLEIFLWSLVRVEHDIHHYCADSRQQTADMLACVQVSQSASSRAVGSRAAPSRPEPEQYFVQHEVTPEDAHRAALQPPAPSNPHGDYMYTNIIKR